MHGDVDASHPPRWLRTAHYEQDRCRARKSRALLQMIDKSEPFATVLGTVVTEELEIRGSSCSSWGNSVRRNVGLSFHQARHDRRFYVARWR
jgi:hypothetical protein